ncbi:MAG TPA: hypothetical protein VMZ03_03460 [Chitinophagaceae bacterium]|nr:hypothetical protein [Chitinophagaceae bacterium]
MQQFQITLKNEKRKLYDRFATLLFLLNGVGISILIYYYGTNSINQYFLYFLSAVCFFSLVYNYYLITGGKVGKYLKAFLAASLLLSLYWVLLGFWWLGVLSFLLILLYCVAQKDLMVIIEKRSISYPSFPSKKIHWNRLNNLILKDGLLTIDFKNNRIIQQYTDPVMTAVNEQEFNEFCREQLNTATSV